MIIHVHKKSIIKLLSFLIHTSVAFEITKASYVLWKYIEKCYIGVTVTENGINSIDTSNYGKLTSNINSINKERAH